MKFLGIDNVIDAKAIIGTDGAADGFRVVFEEDRVVNGRKRTVQKERTVYVREFNPESVASDGCIHGFGNPVVYVRSNGKKKEKKGFELDKRRLEILNRVVGKAGK